MGSFSTFFRADLLILKDILASFCKFSGGGGGANLVLDGERGATALDLLVSGLAMRKIIEEPQPQYHRLIYHSTHKKSIALVRSPDHPMTRSPDDLSRRVLEHRPAAVGATVRGGSVEFSGLVPQKGAPGGAGPVRCPCEAIENRFLAT